MLILIAIGRQISHYFTELATYHGRIKNRKLLSCRNMNGLGPNLSIQKLVHDPDVRAELARK
jgi:hypothetical protein